MPETNPVQVMDKLCRVWSDRKERHIAVHVQFEVAEQDGCRLFTLLSIDELA